MYRVPVIALSTTYTFSFNPQILTTRYNHYPNFAYVKTEA